MRIREVTKAVAIVMLNAKHNNTQQGRSGSSYHDAEAWET